MVFAPAQGFGGSGAATSLSSAAYPLLAPNGTSGAPSYAFSSDTSTGLYKIGSGVIGITGVIVLPDSSASNPSLSFTSDQSIGLFRGVNSGIVGIRGSTLFTDNTAVPYGLTSSNSSLIAGFNAQLASRFYMANAAPGFILQLGSSKGTTASPTAVGSGDLVGRVEGAAYIGTTSGHSTNARIGFYVDAAITDGTSNPGRIVFDTCPAGSLTPTEAMRIDSSQNTSLVGKLRVATATAGAPSLSFTANTDRGFFNDTTNNGVGFTVAGTQNGVISAGGIQLLSTAVFSSTAGTAAAPSYTFATHGDRGLWDDNANSAIGFAAAGVAVMNCSSSGLQLAAGKNLTVGGLATVQTTGVRNVDGSAGTPCYSFTNNTDRGIYNDTGNNGVGIAAGGANIMSVFSSGVQLASNKNLTIGGITTCQSSVTVTGAAANGQSSSISQASELLTLSTSGTTTDTSANLLPVGAVIMAVVCRITTTITTATNWSVGDATTAARFSASNSTLTSGTTSVGLEQHGGSGAAGAKQNAAAKVRITTTGTPGAGAIRITVFYWQFTAPTS
jgi:hypothetical protein